MAEKYLTKRSVKAGSWLMSYNLLARLSGVIKIGIIARILTPSEFGVFGVAALALSLLETFSETGVEQALIQKKNLSEADVASAYVVSVVRGILIGAGLFGMAPLVGRFFASPGSVLFIRAIALAPIVRNLRNPNMVAFRRKLSYKQDFLMRTVGTLADLVVGVVVALLTRSAWGLVASVITGAIMETVMSYKLAPSFEIGKFAKENIKKLVSFGSWLWGSSVLTYLTSQGDDVVVGRIMGTESLGFYQNAYKIASLPATQLTGAMSEVTYSAFSSIQDDKLRLRRGYKKTLLTTVIVTGTLALVIYRWAELLTRLILGDQWLPMVPALKILAFFGSVRAINSTVGPIFKAVGKPGLIPLLQGIKLVVLAILIFPMVRSGGLEGASWAVLISGMVLIPISQGLVWQVLKL